MAISDYDRQHLTTAQQQKVHAFTEAYARAAAANDKLGMEKAHESAEAVRNSAGYSGGNDGSSYTKLSTAGTTSGTAGLKQTSGKGYNNGSLTSTQVKTLQGVLGVSQDGYFGPQTQAAALKMWGTSSADEAMNSYISSQIKVSTPETRAQQALPQTSIMQKGTTSPSTTSSAAQSFQSSAAYAKNLLDQAAAKKAQDEAKYLAAPDPAKTQETPRTLRQKADQSAAANTLAQRVKNTVTGAGKTYGGSMVNAAAVSSEAANIGNQKVNQSRAEAGSAYGDGFGGTLMRMLINNPSSGSASADALRKAMTTVDNHYVPQLERTADKLTESGTADIERAKEGAGKLGRLAVDVGAQGVQMAADLALGLATGGSSLVPMAIRSYGSGAQEARHAGASTAQQVGYGAANAAVEVLTEKMFDGLAGIYGKGGADEVVEKAINKLTKNEAARRALNIAASAAGESLEEFVSGIANPALQTIYNGKRYGGVKQYLSELEASDVLYDMLVGGIMGGLGGVVDTVRTAELPLAAPDVTSPQSPTATAPLSEGSLAKTTAENIRSGTQKSAASNETAALEFGTDARDVVANVAAVVRSDAENRFYLHEVVDGDGNLIYKIDAPADIKTGVTAQGGDTGTAETSYSDTTIAQPSNPVKPLPTAEDIRSGAQKNAVSNETAGAPLEMAYPETNENGLAALSPREIENLSSGKRNKVVSTFREALSFVRNALSDTQNVDRAYLGKVPNAVAQQILQNTGVDVTGYSVMYNGNDVRHIIKNHGDATAEAARGQLAVDANDIAMVSAIIAAPDSVTLSTEVDGKGRRALVFEKQIGDTLIAIEGVADGKHALETDTMRKRKSSQGTGHNAGDIPGPVINAQGEPPQSSFISDTNIAQQSNPVKPLPTAEEYADELRARSQQEPRIEMPETARPMPTAEEYAADYEDWRVQSLADETDERYMQQIERKGKRENQPKQQEKSRATQSRKDLRKDLLSGYYLSREEWQSLAKQVDRLAREMQIDGRVSDEKRIEMIRALAEHSAASIADVEAMEQHFDEAMRRFADKARLEIELKDRLETERTQTKERIAQEKQRARERLQREKEAWREVLRKRDDARKQREAAAQTLRNLKRLRGRIGQNDTRLAEAMSRLSPEEQQIAREALGNISTDAQRLTEKAKSKMAENQARYEQLLANDPNYIPDKKTLALLERMDQTYLADMTTEELMSAHRALQSLEQHLTDMNKEIGKQRSEEFGTLYQASRGEIENSKGRKATSKISKFLNEEQLTPMNYLEMLGGWNEDSVWNKTVAKQLEEGERAKKQFIVESNNMVKDFHEKNAKWIAKSDGQGKGAIWYDIEVPALQEYGEGHKPIFGDTVTVHLTPAMKVELARGIRNADNLRHAEGGVTFPNQDLYANGQRKEAYDRGTTVKLAPETMKKLFAYENLTSEEKALFDLMDQFFDGKAKQAINETSQIMDGVDRALTNHYSKIYTNANYRATDATVVNESIGGMGSLQKRTFSQNPMLAMSVWEAFDDTVDTVAKYHGLAIPTRNVNMLLNWTENGGSMKNTIAQKWGGDAVKYIENLLGDLQNRQIKEKSGIDALAGKALNNYVTATFGMNPGIVLKQFSSFPSAMAALGATNMPSPAKLFGKGVDTELIAKYTPELEYRSMGYATPELAELKNNPNWTQRNPITRFLFGGAIQGMDRFTVKAMWPWAENYVKKNYDSLKPGTDAFYRKTAEVYNEAVGLTQPMYDVMHRAKIMQSGSDLTRAFTMFKTVPLQQQNMLRKAWGEARNAPEGQKGKANVKLAKTIGSIVAANLMFEGIEFLNQAWKNAAKKYRDDDDELTLASAGEKIVMDALGDMAGMFVGGDELMDALDLAAGKKSLYFAGMETPGLSQMNDVITSLASALNSYRKAAEDLTNISQNGGSISEYVKSNGAALLGDFKDLAETMTVYFGGVPVTNIEKYLLGTLRIVNPGIAEEYKALFEKTTKRDLSGLTGESLRVRVSDLMDDRASRISDSAKDELARLYESTGTEVIPSDVPTSLTIEGESRKLTATEQQIYKRAYRETLSETLDQMLTSESYRTLNDEQRAAALTALYRYAADEAKSAAVGVERSTSALKVSEAKKQGLDTAQYFVVKGTLAALEPEEGEEKVGDMQRFRAIAATSLSDDAKLAAIGSIMGTEMTTEAGNPSQYAKMLDLLDAGVTLDEYLDLKEADAADGYAKYLSIGGNYGITPGDYIDFLGQKQEYDADGNGYYKKEEVKAAIDGIFGDTLTQEQKAALWQMNTTAKPKSNPYSVSVGQIVYDGLHREAEESAPSRGGIQENAMLPALAPNRRGRAENVTGEGKTVYKRERVDSAAASSTKNSTELSSQIESLNRKIYQLANDRRDAILEDQYNSRHMPAISQEYWHEHERLTSYVKSLDSQIEDLEAKIEQMESEREPAKSSRALPLAAPGLEQQTVMRGVLPLAAP